MSKILPWKVLKLILQYVHSQRYLAQCALVDSRWLHYAQKELYQSIHFYSFEQFLHFLAIKAWADKDRSPLFMVGQVTFHFDLLSICTALDIKERHTINELIHSISRHDNKHNYDNNKKRKRYCQSTINMFDFIYEDDKDNNDSDDSNDNDDGTKNENTGSSNSSSTTTKEGSTKKKRYNHLIARLLNKCQNVTRIEIVDKEKHMKQLRYMDTSQTDQYSFFFSLTNTITHLPYWHNDAQGFIAAKGHQLQQLDIYASTSGIQIIDNENLYFTLPTFPHLTHLYIDFFNQDQSYVIDRHIMNCIHKNCSHLTNLTLYNVDISILPVTTATSISASTPTAIFNNDNTWYTNRLRLPERPIDIFKQKYAFNIMFINDITSTMVSAPSMEHLSLKNVKILHPTTTTTVDYLIQKYPRLKTIDLELDYIPFGVMSDDIIENRNEFQSAIFKLLTNLPDLTSFHYTLHPAINEECAKAIWPQEKILKWLSSHHHQLTSLSWPCDLYDLSLSPVSSLSQTTILKPTYLLNLKELNLTMGNQCGEHAILYDFLRVDGSRCSRRSILPCLQSLTITHRERALTLSTSTTKSTAQLKAQKDQLDKIKKNNKKIDIFTWLDICPQLKDLTLKGVDLVNTGDHDLKADEASRLIMKKERQEQIYTYPLNKLVLEQVDIYMDDGLDDICTRCPRLKVLWCEYINCRWEPVSMKNYIDNYALFCERAIFTLDASDLTLDTLYLSHINYQLKEHNYTFTLDKAVVYELGISEELHGSNSFSIIGTATGSRSIRGLLNHSNQSDKGIYQDPTLFSSSHQTYFEVYCNLVDQISLIGSSEMDDRSAFQNYIVDQQMKMADDIDKDDDHCNEFYLQRQQQEEQELIERQQQQQQMEIEYKRMNSWECLDADELFETSDIDMDIFNSDEEEDDISV
ncbi:unnamed protein product [Cunninghamella echinulata]